MWLFAANGLALSLARYYLKTTNKMLYYLKYFSFKKNNNPFWHQHVEKKKNQQNTHITSRFVIGPANILFAGECARASTFSGRIFYRHGKVKELSSEGVKRAKSSDYVMNTRLSIL